MINLSKKEIFIINSLSYDPSTGIFVWENPSSTKIKSGSIAGTINNRGYRVISCKNKIYLAHRLAWLIYYLEWPPSNIDHINHDCADNRIVNLRLADQSVNCKNQSVRSNNSSGVVGVWYASRECKWVSEIMVDYKKISLGSFKDKNDAIEKRRSAEVLYGFHENHGRI